MKKILKSAMILSLVASPAFAEDMYTSLSLGTGKANIHTKANNDTINSLIKSKASMPFAGEIAIGTNVAPNFRAEVAYGFMQYSVKGKHSARLNYSEPLLNLQGQSFPDAINIDTTIKTKAKSHSLMLNGYYDFAPWDVVTPYVMGGIGIAKNTLNFSGSATTTNSITKEVGTISSKGKLSHTNLIWQVGAGFEVDAGDNVKIGLGYRYKHIHGAVNKKNAEAKVRLKPIHLALATVRIGL